MVLPMSDQGQWRLHYLQARVQAGARADEVLALLLAAENHEAAVRALAIMLQVDDQTSRGVLDNWGAHLTVKDRAEAEHDLGEHRRSIAQEEA